MILTGDDAKKFAQRLKDVDDGKHRISKEEKERALQNYERVKKMMEKPKKNCDHCGDDPEECCELCKKIICEECYWAIQEYEDDPWSVQYVCNECARKYDNQKQ